MIENTPLNIKVMNYIKRQHDLMVNGKIDRDTFLKRLSKRYSGKTPWDFFDELSDSETDLSFEYVCPIDSKNDLKNILYDLMMKLTYDNGLPLTGENYPPENPTQWNDYFEHYDRMDDFNSIGCDEEILGFFYDEKNDVYGIQVSGTTEEWVQDWTESYDNSSYEHDFK